MIFLYLFITFFQIGLFGFGGGYGMLSLIQGEVVHNHGWMTTGEFTDIVAISQMTPGPIGINSATYCGYTAVHNAGYGYGIICPRVAVVHIDDIDSKGSYKVHEDTSRTERLLGAAACCRGTSWRGHVAVDDT